MFKRFVIQVLMLLSVAGSAWADGPTLNLGSGSGLVGATVTVPVTLTNLVGTNIAALGITIGYNPILLGNPVVDTGPAAQAAGKGATGNFDPDTGVIKTPGQLVVVIAGFNTTKINDGVVANVTFTVLGAGTATLANTPSASTPGGAPVTTITGAAGSISGIGLNQTISFGTAPSMTFGSTANVSAIATSALGVTFSSLTTGVCTVSGNTVTPVAAGTCTIAANQAGNATYNPAPQVTQNITVAKANQTITFGALAGKVYGDAPFTVSATASSQLPVNLIASGACGIQGNTTVTIFGAGSCTITAKQAGNGNYNPASDVPQTFAIAKATPTITWANPADITYGTALSGTQLNATASVPGPITYSPAAGTVLNAGAGQTLTANFTPTDAANYNSASKNVTINVAKATPTITWANPADITYMTPLSGTQLNAAASVPGPITYSPAAGTVLNAGAGQTLTANFTPTDTANYNSASKNVTINVAKLTPTITWAIPADIVYGMALSGTQLNASATGTGSFTYSPIAGTVLNAGAGQTLTANYTPTDTVNYNIVSKNVTINVSKANQTITFGALAGRIYGDAPFTVSATASSQLPVNLIASGACALQGTTVTITGAGSCTITAKQAGDTNYNPASDVPQTFAVAKATPTITWANPADITYGTALSGTQLNATASVPGPITYSPAAGTVLNAGAGQTLTANFTPTDAANYNSASKNVTINVAKATPTITWANPADITYGTALSGTQLNATASVPGPITYSPAAGTVLNAGAVQTLTANFTPTDAANYNSASKNVTINVAKATPTITWANPADITYGTALSGTQLNATASVPGPITYSPAAGTVLNAGAGQTLTASFTPTDTVNYNGASKNVTVNVTKANQTITFGAVPSMTFGGTGTVSATATSGLGVAFSSTTTGVCTVSGSTVTPVTAGTCTIAANQAGNGNYNNSPQVTQNITIAQATQTITFGAAPSITIGGGTGSVSATATSGLAVTFSSLTTGVCTVSGSTVTPVTAGTCTIAANQAGNGNYISAPQATQNINIALATQTITFGAAPSLTFGGGTGSVSATATSGLAATFSSLTTGVCTVSGSTVTPVTAGTCTIAANQAGNGSYSNAPQVTQNITVAKANQTISFGAAPTLIFNGANVIASATATSTLAVTFSSLTTGVCTVSGSTVSPVTAGTCTIAANQAGNGNYNLAPQVTQNITVAQATQTIGSITFAPNSLAVAATTTVSAIGGASGNPVTFTSTTASVCSVSGTTVTGLTAGTCTIAANQAGNANYSAALQVTQNITVGKGSQSIGTITFNPTSLGVGGTAAASATATSGLAVSFASTTQSICTVSGNTVTGVALGTCTIAATQPGNTNYNAASQVSQNVSVLPVPTLSITGPSLPLTNSSSVSYDVTYSGATTINLGPSNSSFVTLNNGGSSANGTVAVTGTGNTRTVTVSNITGDGTLGISIAAGSASNSAGSAPAAGPSATFIVDNTLPTLNFTNLLPDGTVSSDNTVSISGTVSDTSGIKTFTVKDTPVPITTLNTFNTAVTLLAGANTIAVVATDEAGNQRTDSRTITFDVTAPVITITAPVAGSVTGQQTATISGSINKAGTVQITVNSNNPIDATMNGRNFTAQLTLALGPNTIVVTATDTAVPTPHTATSQLTVTFDNVNPVVAITDPAQDITTTLSSYLVKGETTDNNNGVTLSFKLDGVAVTPAPTLTNGAFQQAVSLTTGKTYAVTVTATDQAGNASTVQRNIIYRSIGIADALRALKIAVGLETKTSDDNVLDVAPLVSDMPQPDGVIDVSDAVTLLRKSVGLLAW